MKTYSEPLEITLKTTRHNLSRCLAIWVASVLSGSALTLGICVGTAGHASATTCETVLSEIVTHNASRDSVDTSDPGAVDAFNGEAGSLNSLALSCGFNVN
jgi:hypothetical protein